MATVEASHLDKDDLARLDHVEQLVRNVREELNRLDEEIRVLNEGYEPIDDDEREQIRERFEGQSDSDLVGLLMTLHKCVENASLGRVKSMAVRETVLLTTVLTRFAPVAFGDALAVWNEHSEDEEEDGADA